MDTKNIREKFQSKKVRSAVIAIGLVIVGLLLFAAGIEVGYMKASFNYKFGDSYYHPFDDSHRDSILPGPLSSANGVTGKIVSISLPTIVVADKDNTEKVVLIESETLLRSYRDTIGPGDLKTGDMIVVIGEPNQTTSEVEAKFIRVLPPLPAAAQDQSQGIATPASAAVPGN